MTTLVTVKVPESANYIVAAEIEEAGIKKQALILPGKIREFVIYGGKTIKITEIQDEL